MLLSDGGYADRYGRVIIHSSRSTGEHVRPGPLRGLGLGYTSIEYIKIHLRGVEIVALNVVAKGLPRGKYEPIMMVKTERTALYPAISRYLDSRGPVPSGTVTQLGIKFSFS